MRKGRSLRLAAPLALALAALAVLAASASATQLQRPFLETFGSAEQPEFQVPESIGVNRASGEVLIGVAPFLSGGKKVATFQRFNPDGTPAPFAALGTNVIDGKLGPGGKPCAEEPASCDRTPEEGLSIGGSQIAFDPTNGNIYITQNAQDVADIFSSEGRYLGQLSRAGTKFSQPCGVAVDSDGTVYVAQNFKVSVFIPSANPPVDSDNTANYAISKEIERPCRLALGSGPSMGSIFITTLGGMTLKMNAQTGAYSEFARGYGVRVAVDPTSGNPLIYNPSETGVDFIEARTSGVELAEFDGSLEAAGAPLSRLMVERPKLSSVRDYAIDATGRVYVAPSMSSPPTNILVYGAEPAVVPTVATEHASDITSSSATLSGTVNPEGTTVTECFFEWGPTFPNGNPNWANTTPCEGAIPTDSSDHPVQATISGLVPNGVKYFFRLAAKNENGIERSETRSFLTGSPAETKPATVTGLATATLNGLVHPEGSQYEECFFEWGLASNPGFEHTALCDPPAGAIPPDNGEHPVSAELSGLQEATSYRFRLVAKNEGETQEGATLNFETFGRPRIEAVRASFATQNSATLEAEINPRGFPASYRFEWGPTAAYGHVAPLLFEPIGSGTSQVRVSVQLSGLSPATTYHYRVVASGGAGTTQSEDQVLQTLNSCALPDGRCLELVSPRDPGPVALPFERLVGFQPAFQAAEAPGGLAYEVELGFGGATAGGETLWVGRRGTGGWKSTQYNPSMAGSGQGGGVRYQVLALSPNLECGVVASKLPLTADPVANQITEAGGANLYRRNPNGTYTLLTALPPVELKRFGQIDAEFALAGMSDDCVRVVFATRHRYPGVPGAGESRLYEWEAGTLRNVGWVPGASGEEVAAASAGFGRNTYNAVSEDGTRVFFTAISKAGNDSGNQAVFVRIDGTRTLNVSQSPLAANTGAVYQGATPDGSRVYFTANAGLTAKTSSAGRDLYECRIVTGPGGPECVLTDLSANTSPGGVAEAGGSTGSQIGALVGLADDGSRAYFIARGQLVPGQGRTLAGNEAAGSYSLYLYESASGTVRYVGMIGEGNALNEVPYVTTGETGSYTSRASADGRYLLFESTADLSGYESGGKPMAYLYDALGDGGKGSLACVSCRQDGKPTLNPDPKVGPLTTRPLTAGNTTPTYRAQTLVIRNGKPLVFFRSLDGLAPGGVEGEWGLYEWSGGQVFNIATDLPGATQKNGGAGTLAFLGASADGTDLYFVDAAALNWENPDARRSVWDARVGGGFAPPPTVSECDPTAEGSCQGAGPPAPGAPPPIGSSTFNGPGNVKPEKQKKKHHKKHRKHHKKKGKHKKGKGKKQKGKGNKQGKKNKGKGKKKQKAKRARGADRSRGAGK